MDSKHICQECGQKFTRKGSLTAHQNSLHMDIQFPCDQYEFMATQKKHLTNHNQSVHMKIKHPCLEKAVHSKK